MKKLLAGSLILFGMHTAVAQIRVTKDHMPKTSSSVFYTTANITNSSVYQSTGADITWDYSDLEIADQNEIEYRPARSINPFFFTLDYGVKVTDSIGFAQFKVKDIYDVFKVTTSKMAAEGRSLKYNGLTIPQYYSDKDEIYKFPLEYGDIDSSTFKVKFALAGQLSLVQQGTRVNTVDGWGTLVLPYGTIKNCLRVKTFIDEIDSLRFMSVSLPPIPVKRLEYKWFAEGFKDPVLIIMGNQIANQFQITSIRYQDQERDMVGFYADKTNTSVQDIVQLADTSIVSARFRSWEITPADYTLMNGTSTSDSLVSLKFMTPGKYSVKLTKNNAFGANEKEKIDYITINEVNTTGILENGQKAIRIFPNPFTSEVTIELADQKQFTVEVFDLNGALLHSTVNQEKIELDPALPKGQYLMKVSYDSSVQYFSIVKQ